MINLEDDVLILDFEVSYIGFDGISRETYISCSAKEALAKLTLMSDRGCHCISAYTYDESIGDEIDVWALI